MGNVVLILPPEPGSLRKCLRRLSGASFSWAYLGQSVSDLRRVDQYFEGQGAYIDTTDRFHQAAADLREPYLTYLYEVGRNLGTLRWWITSLSYRDGTTSKTFHQTCYLKVALDLARTRGKGGPLVIVSDQTVLWALEENLSEDIDVAVWVSARRRYPWLRLAYDGLRLLAHRTFFLFREGSRVIQSRVFIPRPYVPTEDTTVLINWMTTRNFDQGGEFHRSFFGDLTVQLGKLGCRVAISPIIWRQLNYKKALQSLNEGSLPSLVPHRYVGLLGLFRVLFASMIRPRFPSLASPLCGMSFRTLAEENLRHHWVGNGAADALLMALVVRRWAQLDYPITRIIYIFENQPYERAICWEVRRSLPNATVVGYQHAQMTPLVLQMSLAPDGEEQAPLPDWIVTLGEHTARVLAECGHAPERLRAGGALHMQSLLAHRSSHGLSPGPPDGPTVLVATERREEATELVDLAVQLFKEDEGVRVILKYHPAFPFSEVGGWSSDRLPPHVSVSTQPITELILKSSVMVYSHSAVCVEALALGLPPIHLRTQFDLNIDGLGAVPHLRLEATNLNELREKVRWLIDHREEYVTEHREEWDRFLQEMYGPVNEDAFRAFLEPSDALKDTLGTQTPDDLVEHGSRRS